MTATLSCLLTHSHQDKLKYLNPTSEPYILTPRLKTFLETVVQGFKHQFDLNNLDPISHKKMIKIIKIFYASHDGSMFEDSLVDMVKTKSFHMKVAGGGMIKLNFLLPRSYPVGLLVSIMCAINTFTYVFPFSYNGLTLYICLDDHARTLNNGAFTVSGVTKPDRMIILTKREEIIKLLFHEMVHYIGLDEKLKLVDRGNFGLTIKDKLNLSEVYAEFMAILLNAAYHAVHLSSLGVGDIYTIFSDLLQKDTQYSLYLSSNILKACGYNQNNYKQFFADTGRRVSCRVRIWEYVILRTQLLLNMNLLTDDISTYLPYKEGWRLDNDSITELMLPTTMIEELTYYMKLNFSNNLSYSLIDFEWSLL